VDPCEGIDCGDGFVCEGGACLVTCSCAGCAVGECDVKSGHCVDTDCAGVACDAGEHCAAGECVDDCEGATCPGGAACNAGVCEPPLSGNNGAGGAGGGDGGGGATEPGIHFGGEGPDPGDGNRGDAAGSGDDGGIGVDHNAVEVKSGCACRAAGGERSNGALVLAGLGLTLLAARRRRSSPRA
jgi:MYXO-CTERM domain-containing protein